MRVLALLLSLPLFANSKSLKCFVVADLSTGEPVSISSTQKPTGLKVLQVAAGACPRFIKPEKRMVDGEDETGKLCEKCIEKTLYVEDLEKLAQESKDRADRELEHREKEIRMRSLKEKIKLSCPLQDRGLLKDMCEYIGGT